MNEYALITPDDLIINALVGADSRARCTIVGLPTRHVFVNKLDRSLLYMPAGLVISLGHD